MYIYTYHELPGEVTSFELNNGLPALIMAQEEVLVAGHSSDSPSEPRRAQSLANHASRQFALADPPTTSSLAETLKDRRTSTDNQASTPWASAANQEAPVDPAGTDIEGANETDDTKHAFHQHYSEDISVESRYLRRSTGSITKEIAFGLLGFLLALMFIGRHNHLQAGVDQSC